MHAPRRSFALWWLSLLLVHGVTATFFALSALFYAQLEGTYLDSCLQFFDIGSATEAYATIALLLSLVALVHALMIVKMLGASLLHRSLAFTFGTQRESSADRALKAKIGMRKKRQSTRKIVVSTTSTRHIAALSADSHATSSRRTRRASTLPMPTWVGQCVSVFRECRYIFGVEGPYFHVILFLREAVETALQTTQAYQMSVYLPRVWLNRFYTVMVVLNCWLIPLVHWLYKRNEAKKRLVCLVCNCALDLVASVAIPCTILASYISEYDLELQGFDIVLWYDDVWLEHVVHEFQLLLVGSWGVLAVRMGFSVGIIMAMSDIKDLVEVCEAGSQINPVLMTLTDEDSGDDARQHVPNASITYRKGPRIRRGTLHANSVSLRLSMLQQRVRGASLLLVGDSKVNRVFTRFTHALFTLWGLGVLALHVYSESTLEVTQCLLQVRPWGRAQAACSLVLLNCYSSEISGSASEVKQQWSLVDSRMVERVLIRHCEALEMPPMLSDFLHLKSLKVYNSTIAEWSDQAALTDTLHPELESLILIRVNFTDGDLPMGLQSIDFPTKLLDIEFSVTNLHTLPPDLDSKWPKYGTLYLEKCAFTAIPDVVFRLLPVYLSFQGNPVQEFPSDTFSAEPLMYLHLGESLLTELPESVTPRPGSTPFYLLVTNTQVATIPSWINEREVEFGLIATGSPLCSQADPESPMAYELQLNASNPNIYVYCEPDGVRPVVPVEFEDRISGLQE